MSAGRARLVSTVLAAVAAGASLVAAWRPGPPVSPSFKPPAGQAPRAQFQEPGQQPSPAFRANVDAVRIDVLATDNGRPIPALRADDFDVKDNGVPQQVDLANLADHVSIVIALDIPHGVYRAQETAELIHASQVLASVLTRKDRAWLITFSQTFDLKVGPTSDPAEIQKALARVLQANLLAPRGEPPWLWDSIFASVALVAGFDGRSLVMVFSDGQESVDRTGWLDENRTFEVLKRGAVSVTAVQPRSVPVSPTALERTARVTGGVVVEAERNARLAEQFTQLLDEYRRGYILTFTPKGVPRGDGWHTLSIKLRNRPGKITSREGYYAGIH